MSKQLVYIITIVFWRVKSGSLVSAKETEISMASFGILFTYLTDIEGNFYELKYLFSGGSWDY
jgi:hypothetical protein